MKTTYKDTHEGSEEFSIEQKNNKINGMGIEGANKVPNTKAPKKPKHNFFRTLQYANTTNKMDNSNLNSDVISNEQVLAVENKINNKLDSQLPKTRTVCVSESDKAIKEMQHNKKTLEVADNVTAGGKPNKNLKVIFLGGVGEIGKNMTALEYGNDIIVIDSGLSFPDEDMPGIDQVIPDITYLKENANKVKAIIITHGHEDHIGAIPYVLKDLNVPVYGTRLSLALIENKLTEFPNVKFKGISVKAGQAFKLGCFNIEFIHVNHSIAGSVALAINTPVGLVVHTGDFKIDYTPISTPTNQNRTTDLNRLAELGRHGVLLLLSESTNICRPGFTMSEQKVGEELDRIFNANKTKRIFVATFATNTYRLQQILTLAEKYGRKVAFSGRSMVNVCETGIKLGELTVNRENIIDIDKVSVYDDKELCILTTGSQGEPMSALSRLASDTFNKIKIGENDCIIMSSSPIPGNEKMVNRVTNALYKKGATVINDELYDVHTSGHACEEEHKIFQQLINPRFLIPVHGEYKHLMVHKQLGIKMGMSPKNIIIPDIGHVVEVNQNYMKLAGVVPSGSILIDGLGMGESDSVVLRDRLQLAEDGLCVVVVGIDSITGEITSGPDLISRGLVYSQEIPDVIGEAKEVVVNTIKSIDVKSTDVTEIRNLIRRSLLGYFSKKTKRRPMILTIIIQN